MPCHIIHVVLPRVFMVHCFLYTTQGDAEDVELQESVYKNNTQGCCLAGVIPQSLKKQFPSPNTLTGILPSSDNLDSNNETELTCLAHGAFLFFLLSVLQCTV